MGWWWIEKGEWRSMVDRPWWWWLGKGSVVDRWVVIVWERGVEVDGRSTLVVVDGEEVGGRSMVHRRWWWMGKGSAVDRWGGDGLRRGSGGGRLIDSGGGGLSRDFMHGCLVDTLNDLLDSRGVVLVAVDVVGVDREGEVHLLVACDNVVVEDGMVGAEHFDEQISDGGVFVKTETLNLVNFSGYRKVEGEKPALVWWRQLVLE